MAEIGETANIFKVFNGNGNSYVAASGEGEGWQGELRLGGLNDDAAHEWLHLFGLEDRYILGITKVDPFSPASADNEIAGMYPKTVKGDANYHLKPNIMVNGFYTNLSQGQVRYLYSQVGVKKPAENGWEFGSDGATKTFVVIAKTGDLDINRAISWVTLARIPIYHPKQSKNRGKKAYNNLSPERKAMVDGVFPN